jgi:hypothetical protein
MNVGSGMLCIRKLTRGKFTWLSRNSIQRKNQRSRDRTSTRTMQKKNTSFRNPKPARLAPFSFQTNRHSKTTSPSTNRLTGAERSSMSISAIYQHLI